MNVENAYNRWSDQYDTNDNKTRDLEAIALKEILAPLSFKRCLEVGCGTGKNTVWLAQQAPFITAVDFSQKMLERAKEKIPSNGVQFIKADINASWNFVTGTYDLVTFSLVLEHIENLQSIFGEAAKALSPGGYLYIGELHPFKQYTGSKARFATEEGIQVVPCFTHHISQFTSAAKAAGFSIEDVREFFDEDDTNEIPRILGLLFRKET